MYYFLLNRSLISFHMCNFQIHDLLGCVPQTMLSLALSRIYLIQGGPHLLMGRWRQSLLIWSPELSFPCRTVHLWKPLLFRNKFSQSLRPASACFSGTGWSWQTERFLLLLPWYVGVSLELFLFLIFICVVKLGYLIRASHSTECHLTPTNQTRYQILRVASVPGAQVWGVLVKAFSISNAS